MKKFRATPRYYTNSNWNHSISSVLTEDGKQVNRDTICGIIDAIVMIAEKLEDEDIVRELLEHSDYSLQVIEEEN